MDINELYKVSPLRAFDASLGGGFGKGKVGIITSRKGVGKTACIVHLATDKLFKGENVIHVSFSGNVEHVIGWYKEVYKEIISGKGIEKEDEVYEKMVSNRVIMNFSQEKIEIKNVLHSLETLINEGGFKADALFFDGYKLNDESEKEFDEIKTFAEETNTEVWLAVSSGDDEKEYDEYGTPRSLKKLGNKGDVLVSLRFSDKKDKVKMTIVSLNGKDATSSSGVLLDPKTMLILHE